MVGNEGNGGFAQQFRPEALTPRTRPQAPAPDSRSQAPAWERPFPAKLCFANIRRTLLLSATPLLLLALLLGCTQQPTPKPGFTQGDFRFINSDLDDDGKLDSQTVIGFEDMPADFSYWANSSKDDEHYDNAHLSFGPKRDIQYHQFEPNEENPKGLQMIMQFVESDPNASFNIMDLDQDNRFDAISLGGANQVCLRF